MVYTVTFNPAIDYIARVEKLTLGETNRTYEETIHPGGKGINVSIVMRRLGVDSHALGFIGGFTGAAIKDMLRETGITTDF
ncbi:MAG: 1-phosphofructokinase, partial [Clostridiales bacterium]|nr:1-phosphofructokinase [Clostridiales bacterium]